MTSPAWVNSLIGLPPQARSFTTRAGDTEVRVRTAQLVIPAR